MIDADINAVLKGKTPLAQDGWMKAIRHLVAFAAVQSKKDPDEVGMFAIKKTRPSGVITDKPPKSDGHLTWGEEQIEQYRARYPVGTMARLALELALNIAARRHDVREIGRQHLKNGAITWRPSKTSRTTGKVLTIRVLPELQAALDAMPRSDELTFLLTEYGRPFKSAADLWASIFWFVALFVAPGEHPCGASLSGRGRAERSKSSNGPGEGALYDEHDSLPVRGRQVCSMSALQKKADPTARSNWCRCLYRGHGWCPSASRLRTL